MNGNWNYPTAVRFGAGRIAELAAACRELGMTKPLFVTDQGLAELPVVQDTLRTLRESLPVGLYSHVQGNPTGENVEGGVEMLRSGGYDGVIAFGGGSGLDAAKAIALLAHQTRPLWDFEDRADWWTRVDPNAMVPVVAVPTTAGTGSEVGRASVITDSSDHTKKIIFHPKMLPPIVIADAELTVGLPPHLTAATGMDALSHALEAYCAPGFHPMADGIAVEAIRLVQQHLRTAVADGANLEARAGMLAASLMGATAFQKGLGAMHSMAHIIGARLGAHHGLLNAIVMPYVLVHNRAAIEDRIADLARAMGLEPSFDAFLDWVLAMRRDLGIPDTLHAVQVLEEHIVPFAAAAVDDPSTGSNPVAMDAAGFESLFRAALGLS